MTATVFPSTFDIEVLLRRFVMGVLPEDVEVIKGQDNRVPMPKGPNFIVFWPLRQERLETNVDHYVDMTFIGSIKGNLLTVEEPRLGSRPSRTELEARLRKLQWLIRQAHEVIQRIEAGDLTPDVEKKYVDDTKRLLWLPPLTWGSKMINRKMFGHGLQWGTVIEKRHEKQSDTFYLNKSYNIKSQLFAAGMAVIEQHMQVTYQLDIYGPNSEENVAIVSTCFRDQYGVESFMGYPPQGFLLPLYTSEPHFLAFVNAEKQFEKRWIIELVMQANRVVENVAQQFADRLQLQIIDVAQVPGCLGYVQNVIAAPPPPQPWERSFGARVMKLERILADLHRRIDYVHSGKLVVI